MLYLLLNSFINILCISHSAIVCTLPPLSAGRRGVVPPIKFQKGGVDKTSTFRRGLLGKVG